jgi:hypothetical protein
MVHSRGGAVLGKLGARVDMGCLSKPLSKGYTQTERQMASQTSLQVLIRRWSTFSRRSSILGSVLPAFGI